MSANANAAADLPYAPAPGDIDWHVIKFLKENDDEELTAIDIGVKFDIATDLVEDKLRRATVHEYLRKSTNRQGAKVWKLGAKPLRLAPMVAGTVPTPLPVTQRYANRVSLPTINRKTPLMDDETRRRNELNQWLLTFEPGDSVTFQKSAYALEDMRKHVARFRKDQPAYYFGFVVTAPGEWGMERRAEAPKIGRRKGQPAPVAKKKPK